jgi:hypothetical protein
MTQSSRHAVLGAALEDERVEAAVGLHVAAPLERAVDVGEVGKDDEHPDRDSHDVRRPPGERQGEGEEDEEENEVPLEGRLVGVELEPLLAPLPV